jgi:hypothetical protein
MLKYRLGHFFPNIVYVTIDVAALDPVNQRKLTFEQHGVVTPICFAVRFHRFYPAFVIFKRNLCVRLDIEYLPCYGED